ncbi:MAG: hypothetical protein ACE5F6_04450 [Anaerolineae bacterium]
MQCSTKGAIVQLAKDAQPRIRGKCPPELAGYDTCAGAGISQAPIASLCTALSVAWPLEVAQNLVPNS